MRSIAWPLCVAILSGCAPPMPAAAPAARSCADPGVEGAPCEGSFTCNDDCRVAADGWAHGCLFGRIRVFHNDCWLSTRHDDAGPAVRSCTESFMRPGAPCTGTFTCNADCRAAVGPYAYTCTAGTLAVSSNGCVPDDGGPTDADVDARGPDAGPDAPGP